MTDYYAKIKHILLDAVKEINEILPIIDGIDADVESGVYTEPVIKAKLYDRAEQTKKIDKIKEKAYKAVKKATDEETKRLYKVMDIDYNNVDSKAIDLLKAVDLTDGEIERLYENSNRDTQKVIARMTEKKGIFPISAGFDRELMPIVNAIKAMPTTISLYYLRSYEDMYYPLVKDAFGNKSRVYVEGWQTLLNVIDRQGEKAEQTEQAVTEPTQITLED